MAYTCKNCGNLTAEHWKGYDFCSQQCYQGRLTSTLQAIKDKKPVTYLIKAGNFVKIGSTTAEPKQRIADLQTGCPYKLELLALTLQTERQLQERFHKHHFRGEWFRLHQDFWDFIENEAETAMHAKDCPVCHKEFFTHQITRIYCTDACKQKNYRRKEKIRQNDKYSWVR